MFYIQGGIEMGRVAVKMRADYEPDGKITPLKFKYINAEQAEVVVPVGRVKSRDISKLAGNKMVVFRCETQIGSQVKEFELRYEVDTQIWYYYY